MTIIVLLEGALVQQSVDQSTLSDHDGERVELLVELLEVVWAAAGGRLGVQVYLVALGCSLAHVCCA